MRTEIAAGARNFGGGGVSQTDRPSFDGIETQGCLFHEIGQAYRCNATSSSLANWIALATLQLHSRGNLIDIFSAADCPP